jgi:4-hydroxy-tetrahydrodipicolinate synthase
VNLASIFSIEKIFPIRYPLSGRFPGYLPMPLPRLIAAVPTPLDDVLRISAEPLARHCKSLFSRGCEGVVLFGTTGEGTLFSASEKLQALEDLIALGLEPSRLLVATGTSALSDAALVVAGAREAGCLGSLVLPPFFTKHVDDRGLEEWFARLIAKAGANASLFLYHIPAVSSVGFSPSLVKSLMQRHSAVVRGLKDSSADSALAAVSADAGLPGIYVSTEVDLAANLACGMAGTISASLNLTVSHVVRALKAGAPDLSIAHLRKHLANHSLVWAVKTAIWRETGDDVWRRLAPPHVPPSGVSEHAFLQSLEELQTASA